ncbi:MAG: class I SAM-dependent methyltransferase [Edaphobacter sp.]
MTLELEYWKSILAGLNKPKVPILPYVPKSRQLPPRVLPIHSAWKGIESVLSDLINQFGIGTERCLEFGVERGYSTAALSCFFDSVTGVDTFKGDKHSGKGNDFYASTLDRLSTFDNIHLVRSDYRDWIANDSSFYDLIHVDIIHTYSDTYRCGLWSANHSQCVIFHDTESFPAVKRVLIDLSRDLGKTFYNFTESYGLGILI